MFSQRIRKPLPPLVDIHSHILPGVDDGAQTLTDALELLRLAVKDGVRLQVLTPHIQVGRYANDRQRLEAAFDAFKCHVDEAGIPIQLKLAAEVRIGAEVRELVDADRIPWLGCCNGHNSFLLEFPQNSVPVGSINLIQWLRRQNILPIIVHPERNLEFQGNPDKLRPFIEAGCPVQITAASLLGRFGPVANKSACELLSAGQVDVIASDCHNLAYRPPNLSLGVKMAAKLIGHKEAVHMAVERPLELLGNSQGSTQDVQLSVV